MAENEAIRLGTRASELARWQADWVAARLAEAGHAVQLVEISTAGDQSSQPIDAFEARGVFTTAIQRALLEGRIDLAVHSLKDLPTETVPGLALAAVPPREETADALVTPGGISLDDLPGGARVGTGSLRRKAQLLAARPDLVVHGIRGNVGTRLGKLDDGQFDAIVLAVAGLKRLGLGERIGQILSAEVMLPAVGQGALGLEIRGDDSTTRAALATLDDRATHAAVTAERAALAHLQGGCLAPIGALGQLQGEVLSLECVVLSPEGDRSLRGSRSGPSSEPIALGQALAEELLGQGAGELIDLMRGGQG